MSENNTPNTEAVDINIDINGRKFSMEPVNVKGRKKKDGTTSDDTVYLQPVFTDPNAVTAFLTSLVGQAEKIKAGSAKDLVLNLFKAEFKQATLDSTKEDGPDGAPLFKPTEYVVSLATAERARTSGEKIADLREALANVQDELLNLYEIQVECGGDAGKIAARTGGEIKSVVQLTQIRAAKSEKRRALVAAIEEKEARAKKAKATKEQNEKGKDASAPAPATA